MANQEESFWSMTAVASLLLLILYPSSTQAANILGFFPFAAYSQSQVFRSLTTELAGRGHHVTFVTPFPMDSPPPNHEQIHITDIFKHFTSFNATKVTGIIEVFRKLHGISSGVCVDVLGRPDIQRLMDPEKSGKKFDLMLMSNFFSDCFLGFAHVYHIPVIQISPGGAMPQTDSLMGNTALSSFVPISFLPFSDRMSFLERMINHLSSMVMSGYLTFIRYSSDEYIIKQYFGDEIPPLRELQSRISLVILNSDFSIHYPRPLPPNIIECIGMHVKAPKPLPQQLQSFMDEAKEGVIYFSMGSNVKSAEFSAEKRDAILAAFAELKEKVLWKWEGDGPLPGQSSNVKLEKWVPQSDLLAHPNIKLFITHGGMLSLLEAAYRGVPLIGIPFYGDQKLNMEKASHLGVCIKVSYEELTKENLLSAIRKILDDPSYHDNMKELSKRVNDQPIPPLEKAVYWTEYVLRHKGAKHLTPASVDLYWFQLYQLDVISTIVLTLFFFLFSFSYVIVNCSKLLKKKKKVKSRPKVKKN
ncbi:UDP-glycosyltransferase [Ladona fulva]|uniref:UDP-glucuronosyltransferase n=1 Tax=Ladona fulva TaxID=123851 RepID=A0A8K0K685_LADFU|nr:UDP-glycosyltransferase [Ladona fulva]